MKHLPILLLGLLLSALSRGAGAAPILMDCGYYRSDPSAFVVAAHRLLDVLERKIEQDPTFRDAVANGGRLTDRAYALGLIGRVADCNHVAGGTNIEVFAGAFPEPGGAQAVGTGDGLTLVIHALPNSHCTALQNARTGHRNGRRAVARFEPPGSPPDSFGVCRVGNPLMSFGNLPQPNTVYVFQPLRPHTQQASESCLFSEELPEGAIAEQFFNVFYTCGATPDAPLCRTAVAEQAAAIDTVHRLRQSRQLADVPASERAELLLAMMSPLQPKARHRDARNNVYKINPGNNVDEVFWRSDLPRVQEIIERLRASPPAGDDAKAVAEHISHIVWDTLGLDPIPIRIVAPQVSMSACGASMESNNGDPYIQFQNCLANLHGPGFYETVLEEAFHYYQFDMAERFCRGEIPPGDVAHTQALLFFLNTFSYSTDGWSRLVGPIQLGDIPYVGQPNEIHAKGAAWYIRTQALN